MEPLANTWQPDSKTGALPGLSHRFDSGSTLTNERTYGLTDAPPTTGSSSRVPDAPNPVDKRDGRVEKRHYRSLWPRIEELNALGWSSSRIAAELGCAEKTVHRWRVRNGLAQTVGQNVGRRVSAERLERARRMFDDGASRSDVGRTLGMAWATIDRHFPGTAWTPEQAGEAAAMSRKLRAL